MQSFFFDILFDFSGENHCQQHLDRQYCVDPENKLLDLCIVGSDGTLVFFRRAVLMVAHLASFDGIFSLWWELFIGLWELGDTPHTHLHFLDLSPFFLRIYHRVFRWYYLLIRLVLLDIVVVWIPLVNRVGLFLLHFFLQRLPVLPSIGEPVSHFFCFSVRWTGLGVCLFLWRALFDNTFVILAFLWRMA
jgi:hypothetical protein